MSFWPALIDFMFGDAGRLADDYLGPKLLVFSVSSSFFGFLVVFLDRILYSVKGKSVFDLSYGTGIGTSARLIALWGLGAGIGGFLGAGFSLLQLTRTACIGVGVGWPLVLPRLYESLRNADPEQRPTA